MALTVSDDNSYTSLMSELYWSRQNRRHGFFSAFTLIPLLPTPVCVGAGKEDLPPEQVASLLEATLFLEFESLICCVIIPWSQSYKG